MAFSRFGASKYRNAVPSIPHRDGWYRAGLPSASATSNTSSAVTTFSSEIKTNREWIVTLTQAGDLSYRPYHGDSISLKVGSGGGVGDWDLSRCEDGLLVVGGLDGAVSAYQLPSASAPRDLTPVSTIPPSSSPITNLSLHPTTPNILLISTTASPASIYDLSNPKSSAIILDAKEPKGMWSIAWKSDGRLVAGVGRSGMAYVWEPRSGKEPKVSRLLPIQPLKPARIRWIGEDIFITSFSKTRNRQYSLLSGSSLSTTFTQSLDTNPGVLLPLVDEERKIIYVAGRGDMTLRQIELSGPQGYQETLHPLQFPLANASLAAVHSAKLDVMKAEISRILIPIVDKDGDSLLPVSIKVPRRQLIDFHEDLYPDLLGFVPEQTASDWLKGEDNLPLPISLNPSRRGTWETQVENLAKERQNATLSKESADKPVLTTISEAQSSKPENVPLAPGASAVQSAPSTSQKSKYEPVANPNLPSLHGDEDYSSTSYQARIIADYLVDQVTKHKSMGNKGPLMVGLQGPQGCGKTTLTTALVSYLKDEKQLKLAILSTDDLYKTHDGLKSVVQQHPDNALLAGRGPPGTHDIALAVETIKKVNSINDSPGSTVDLPVFDKSLCGGEGDRSADKVLITGPLDVFILEGWSMGFKPLSESDLKQAYGQPKPASPSTSKIYFPNHPLSSLLTLNSYLADFASSIYPSFTTFIQIEPESFDYVFDWRLEQEHWMKAKNGGKGMSDEQVQKFVERYMPGYELWKDGIWSQEAPWIGQSLRLKFGENRELLEMGVPPSQAPATSTSTKANNSSASTAEAPKPMAQKDVVQTIPAKTPEPATTATSTVAAQAQPQASTKPTPTLTQAASTTERFNPHWSRKFLAAKSPLIPTYDSLPSISSLHQDSQILRVTPHLAFFPIQGTGGRLCVHPLKKKGRVAVGGEGYLTNGVEIVDFDAELGDGGRVAVAGEDGAIRVWKIDEDGVQGVGPGPGQVLHGKNIDKFTQILFHPTARDLLVGVTNDYGQAHIRFWDLSKGEEVKVVDLPAPSVYRLAFSPAGDKVAIGTKDGRLVVFDPRDPETVSSGKAHDSPRSFQISWIDDNHIVSVGFSRGSQRKILLYRLPSSAGGEITTISSVTIDVSPSVLFPVYDSDTSILYVWGKGERVIQAYEIHPDDDREPIAKLSGFTGDSPQIATIFLPKRMVDMKKVEIAKALRLTAKTLEEPGFFQDDIYVPTKDIEKPSMTASEWLEGENVAQGVIDLKPEGMTPLSLAPKADTTARKKFVPAKNVMSEEEKKRKEMDDLFAKAKMDESSSDEEETTTGLDPPDDDW
ncbi:actin cross-linking [Cryptococcus deuterogattii 99/473]|uniref:Actin cross-linking n=1 Tax=Cryptococcus deuterogattii Ram5 TaxID=1296110 RepID=A0A0D0UZ71_9TREE|nr:actin cross-linking [Cryptococcus deuterogattii Ram5]KIY54478.1 actin cross-linking [Cryptococcus deuterogattii 99/473]